MLLLLLGDTGIGLVFTLCVPCHLGEQEKWDWSSKVFPLLQNTVEHSVIQLWVGISRSTAEVCPEADTEMQLLVNVFKTGGMYWEKKHLRDLFPLGCAFLS